MKMVESEGCEFKRSVTPRLAREVIAFLNGRGGVIYVGVEDDGTVSGVGDSAAAMLAVESMVRDAIQPDVTELMRCSVVYGTGLSEERHSNDEAQCVRIDVSAGVSKPYFLRSKGLTPHGVYVRQGTSSIPATNTAIRRMVREADGERFEDLRSLCQDLTFEKAQSLFKANGVAWGTSQMRSLGLLSDDGVFTNLALLLSDQCPPYLKAAWFDGTAAGQFSFRNRDEFTGSIFQQLEDAFRFIDDRNNLASKIEGLERIDIRDYPVDAVREALINAVVHREYSFSDATLVKMFDDQMQIVNLGGLPDGIELQDIAAGVSRLRNPKLAGVFFRLKLIEAYGTGIAKIRSAYRYDVKRPQISFSKGAFTIALPNRSYKNALSNGEDTARSGLRGTGEPFEISGEGASSLWLKSRTAAGEPSPRNALREEGGSKRALASFDLSDIERTVRFIEVEGEVTRKQIEELLGVGQTTAGKVLRGLAEDGVIVQEGRGPSTRYRLAG